MKTLQIIAGIVTVCLGLLLLVLAGVSAMSLHSLVHCVVVAIEAVDYAAIGVGMLVWLVGGMIPISIFVIAVITIAAGVAIMIGAKK